MARNPNRQYVEFHIESEVVRDLDAEPEYPYEPTKTVWYVVARIEGSERYWYDYAHDHTFQWEGDAKNFLSHIQKTLGLNVPVERLKFSEHWLENTEPDPLDDLAPFGPAWEREMEEERRSYPF
jgi:hypothetical protein